MFFARSGLIHWWRKSTSNFGCGSKPYLCFGCKRCLQISSTSASWQGSNQEWSTLWERYLFEHRFRIIGFWVQALLFLIGWLFFIVLIFVLHILLSSAVIKFLIDSQFLKILPLQHLTYLATLWWPVHVRLLWSRCAILIDFGLSSGSSLGTLIQWCSLRRRVGFCL